jgi:hypothetical protein
LPTRRKKMPRALIVIGWEQDPADEYLLAPKGLEVTEAVKLADSLMQRYMEDFDYESDEEWSPVTHLLNCGFDIADWARAETEL